MFVTTTRVAVVGFALTLAVGTPAAAYASHTNHGHHGPAAGHGNGHGNGAGHGKGHNKDKFTAVGSVASVDAGTVTVNDKGGSKSLHGTAVTISVPDDATVIVNDTPGSLSDVAAGDHVVVKGSDANDSYTASKVVASTPDAGDSTSEDQGSESTD